MYLMWYIQLKFLNNKNRKKWKLYYGICLAFQNEKFDHIIFLYYSPENTLKCRLTRDESSYDKYGM